MAGLMDFYACHRLNEESDLNNGRGFMEPALVYLNGLKSQSLKH